MNRRDTVEAVARLIVAVTRPHPVRVAIDGIDAAGKTMLADELAAAIRDCGRPVIRASIDGFHNARFPSRFGTVEDTESNSIAQELGIGHPVERERNVSTRSAANFSLPR